MDSIGHMDPMGNMELWDSRARERKLYPSLGESRSSELTTLLAKLF